MQLTATATIVAPQPQLGRWVERPELAGTRTSHRDRAGWVIDEVSGFEEYATQLIGAWDYYGDGTVGVNELRRTQQHLYGSNPDGSTDPDLFVWPNTTVRQEVVSMEPLFAAAKGADQQLTAAEVLAFVRGFDRNGNGYLDTRHHSDGSVDERTAFMQASSPVVLGARQLTVEGKLEGVGHTIDDRWAERTKDLPLPPATDPPQGED